MINPDSGDLGAKVGFVFAGMGLLITIFFFFDIPETKGLSLDEVSVPASLSLVLVFFPTNAFAPPRKIDYLFNNKVSCRHFQSAIKEFRAQHGGAHLTDLKAIEEVTHIEDSKVADP